MVMPIYLLSNVKPPQLDPNFTVCESPSQAGGKQLQGAQGEQNGIRAPYGGYKRILHTLGILVLSYMKVMQDVEYQRWYTPKAPVPFVEPNPFKDLLNYFRYGPLFYAPLVPL